MYPFFFHRCAQPPRSGTGKELGGQEPNNVTGHHAVFPMAQFDWLSRRVRAGKRFCGGTAIGIQLIGRPFEEELVLAVAERIENGAVRGNRHRYDAEVLPQREKRSESTRNAIAVVARAPDRTR